MRKLVYLFLLNITIAFSQQEVIDKIINPLQDNSLYREKVFIHTNKTGYFVNENIWFSVYVSKTDNTPSEYTSNLQVNFLNGEGKVIERKNVFIKNGKGEGNFSINSNLSSGTYYINGLTNYMKNFGAENQYLQEIEVINPKIKNQNTPKSTNVDYDIQLHPESGYLLEDAENTLGIKVLVNGKGKPFMGNLKNSKGVIVSEFSGNFLGFSKCKFQYLPNETYYAEIDINGTKQKIDLPKAQNKGVIFSIDNFDEEELRILLKTNKLSMDASQKKEFVLLFHRNNKVLDAVTLRLNNQMNTEQELIFSKDKLLYGVNTVTLFENYQPIAQRKFFVDKQSEQSAVLIEKLDENNDFISYKINTIDANAKNVKSSLSISTLPLDSKLFSENQHIKTAFLLSPYLKGHIENPSYYFSNKSENQKAFLDLLLLNQGWLKYDLSTMINTLNPKEEYEFESGFTIKGTVKKNPKGYDIGLLSKKNRLTTFSKIDKKRFFQFDNIYAYKSDTVRVVYLKKNKQLLKPNKISFTQPNVSDTDFNIAVQNISRNNIKGSTGKVEKMVSSTSVERLEEVVLKDVKRKKEETYFDLEENIAERRKEIASTFYENKKVSKKDESNFQTVFDYLRHKGVIKGPCFGQQFSPCYFELRSSQLNIIGTKPKPRIYLDGVNFDTEDAIREMRLISMKDVDELLLNRSGAGGGIDSYAGIIKIYLKKGNHQYFEEPSEELYKNLVLLTGYDRAEKYYKPYYTKDVSAIFDWTEIDWKSNLTTDEDGETVLKVPANKMNKKYQLIINGFSENGLLFNYIYKDEESKF